MQLSLVSLNVAVPRVIAVLNDAPVLSAIAKNPVHEARVHVGKTNIEGDAQGDLTVHGGVDKAVYAYPTANWPWWESEHGLVCGPATMGENLTLDGATEDDVAIGDRFQWGDAVLEISQPRAPCYKLALHTARDDVPMLMTVSAKCGWYYRVVHEGEAPGRGAGLSRIGNSHGPTVRETFRALFDRRVSPEICARIRDVPQLAEAWKRGLTKKLSGRA
ncbi:MAG TPA: MOSC domain-containing protein [Rhizomicrobium sp.]|jgi:MOSC domain-containing protein YiiM